MKEELLNQLRNELTQQKQAIEKANQEKRRIKELLKSPFVKEYTSLLELEQSDLKLVKKTDKEIISSFYHHYLHQIDPKDTNEIYVYLGTYHYSIETDIVHGSNDERVDYSSPLADYRTYWNIEQPFAESISINKCEQFEKKHFIINPESYFKEREYYEIQKEFFIKAVKSNQTNAKKMILKKHKLLNK